MPDNAGESDGDGNRLFNGKETLLIDGAGINEDPNDIDGTKVIPLPLIWAWDGKGINSKANNARIITLSVLGTAFARKSPKTHYFGRKSYVVRVRGDQFVD